MRSFIFGVLLASAAPAAGQQVATPAPETNTQPIDPARLALATQTVDFLWPLGTYARVMDEAMDAMMNAMRRSMLNMPVGDAAKGDGAAAADSGAGMKVRDALAAADPHYEERMRITTRVMMDEMIALMTRVEPDIRAALSRAYAARFTSAQLADMNRFFATPSGRAYARESMAIMMAPEMMAEMGKMTPMMFEAMPRIAQKTQAATAHLPPPPKPKEEAQDDEEGVPHSD